MDRSGAVELALAKLVFLGWTHLMLAFAIGEPAGEHTLTDLDSVIRSSKSSISHPLMQMCKCKAAEIGSPLIL